MASDALGPARSGGMGRLLALASGRVRKGENLSHLVLVIMVIACGFALVAPGAALSAATWQSMMYQLPELALLSLAMAVPLISGGLNLAIVATANAASLLMAAVVVTLAGPGSASGVALGAVMLGAAAGLLLCILIGILTGLLIAVLRVHPLLVTIGTMSVIAGMSISLTRGRIISGFPPIMLALSSQLVFGLPLSFLVMLAAFGLVAFVLSWTSFGQTVFMIGSNIESTRFSGVSTLRVQVGVYVMSSVLCWAAGLIMMARFNSASAGYAGSYLLITILAAVLGGINPFGGFGRVTGLLLSLLILQLVSTVFNLLGLDQQLTMAIWGILLIVVLAATSARSRAG